MKLLGFFRWPSQPLHLWLLILSVPALSFGQTRHPRVAVLGFGASTTSPIVERAIRSMFSSDDPNSPSHEFEVIDPELTKSAARGAGYNLSLIHI